MIEDYIKRRKALALIVSSLIGIILVKRFSIATSSRVVSSSSVQQHSRTDPFAGIPSRVSDAASSVGGAPAIADLDPVAVAEARGALSGVVPSGVMAGLALLVELDASGVVVDVRDFAGVLSGPTLARVRAIMVGRRLFGPSVLVTTGWRLIRF